ncbi:MAG TPA: response regulator transcription factor [Micromonosporaceae bacterium]|nr:response regulator transcription factor [Micromonosporaceae bacterium]
MIAVLVAAKLPLIRQAVAEVLAREADIKVTAELGSPRDLNQSEVDPSPDVMVIDVDSFGAGGFRAVGELCHRLPKCFRLLLIDAEKNGNLNVARSVPAQGVVARDVPAERVVDAVRTVAAGRRVVDPRVAVAALQARDNPFSEREEQVLRLAARGTPIREIAVRLHLAVGTVRNNLWRINRKTGARNRIEAIRLARESGWLVE